MDVSLYYGTTIAIPVLVICAHALMLRLPALRESAIELLQHYFLKRLSDKLKAFGSAARRRLPPSTIVLCVFFILVNVFSVTIDISRDSGKTTLRLAESAAFLRRLGGLTLINLLVLFTTGQLHPVAATLSISYKLYRQAHAWVGFSVMATAILHCFLGLGELTNAARSAGFVTVVSIVILCLSSTPQLGFRDRFYEVFADAHFYISIVVLGATWIHLYHLPVFSPPKLYLFFASCVYGFVRLFRLACMIQANTAADGKKSTATIRDINGDMEVRIRLARPLSILPGQFIYLRLPLLRTPSTLFQSHPFQIAWDYFEMDQHTIVLHVEPRQGFSLAIAVAARQGHQSNHVALLEGPYGRPVGVDNCEIAIIFATGIGIAGQLIHIRELLLQEKVEHVLLYWEVRDES
jgi:predicted ferric reductase